MALLTACAGQQAPQRSPLPAVSDVVAEPTPCRFLLGEGSGARVVEVTPASSADGNLQVDDVVLAVDGVTIDSFDQLRDVVAQAAVGQTLSIELDRAGQHVEVTVQLQRAEDDPARPLLGIKGSTVLEPVEPGSLPTVLPAESPLTRTVSVDGKLYRYDPTTGTADNLGLETPSDPWAYVQGRLFTLRPVGTDQARLEVNRGAVESPAGVEILLGVIGGKLLVEINHDGARVAALVDPAGGAIAYEIPFTDVIPYLAFPSPDATRLLIGAGTSTTEYSFSLYDAATGEEIPSDLSTIQNEIVTGWFDSDRLLVATADEGIGLLDPVTGRFEPANIQTQLAGDDRVYPVGDGRRAFILTASDLVIAAVGDEVLEARPVISGCGVESVGRFGS